MNFFTIYSLFNIKFYIFMFENFILFNYIMCFLKYQKLEFRILNNYFDCLDF